MPIKLVCVHEFHNYKRGQEILDPEEVAAHLEDREHHFVKVEFTEHDEARLTAMREAAVAESDAAMEKATKAQYSHAHRGDTVAPDHPAPNHKRK